MPYSENESKFSMGYLKACGMVYDVLKIDPTLGENERLAYTITPTEPTTNILSKHNRGSYATWANARERTEDPSISYTRENKVV
jgi:hypothetical protein